MTIPSPGDSLKNLHQFESLSSKRKKKKSGSTSCCTSSFFEKVYILENILNDGAFGVVHKGYHVSDPNKEFAIKVVEITSRDDVMVAYNEASILRLLTELDNVIELIDFYSTNHNIYFVQALAKGGDLFDKIVEKKRYSELDAQKLVKNLIDTISSIHKHHVIHRDIKPENILLKDASDDTSILLCDFGDSKRVAQSLTNDDEDGFSTICGTPAFTAPEVIAGEKYKYEVDMWSIGCIVFMLLEGAPPFGQEDETSIVYQLSSIADYTFDDDAWKVITNDAKNLITNLLRVNPKERLTAQQALQSSWIDKGVKAAKITTEAATKTTTIITATKARATRKKSVLKRENTREQTRCKLNSAIIPSKVRLTGKERKQKRLAEKKKKPLEEEKDKINSNAFGTKVAINSSSSAGNKNNSTNEIQPAIKTFSNDNNKKKFLSSYNNKDDKNEKYKSITTTSSSSSATPAATIPVLFRNKLQKSNINACSRSNITVVPKKSFLPTGSSIRNNIYPKHNDSNTAKHSTTKQSATTVTTEAFVAGIKALPVAEKRNTLSDKQKLSMAKHHEYKSKHSINNNKALISSSKHHEYKSKYCPILDTARVARVPKKSKALADNNNNNNKNVNNCSSTTFNRGGGATAASFKKKINHNNNSTNKLRKAITMIISEQQQKTKTAAPTTIESTGKEKVKKTLKSTNKKFNVSNNSEILSSSPNHSKKSFINLPSTIAAASATSDNRKVRDSFTFNTGTATTLKKFGDREWKNSFPVDKPKFTESKISNWKILKKSIHNNSINTKKLIKPNHTSAGGHLSSSSTTTDDNNKVCNPSFTVTTVKKFSDRGEKITSNCGNAKFTTTSDNEKFVFNNSFLSHQNKVCKGGESSTITTVSNSETADSSPSSSIDNTKKKSKWEIIRANFIQKTNNDVSSSKNFNEKDRKVSFNSIKTAQKKSNRKVARKTSCTTEEDSSDDAKSFTSNTAGHEKATAIPSSAAFRSGDKYSSKSCKLNTVNLEEDSNSPSARKNSFARKNTYSVLMSSQRNLRVDKPGLTPCPKNDLSSSNGLPRQYPLRRSNSCKFNTVKLEEDNNPPSTKRKSLADLNSFSRSCKEKSNNTYSVLMASKKILPDDKPGLTSCPKNDLDLPSNVSLYKSTQMKFNDWNTAMKPSLSNTNRSNVDDANDSPSLKQTIKAAASPNQKKSNDDNGCKKQLSPSFLSKTRNGTTNYSLNKSKLVNDDDKVAVVMPSLANKRIEPSTQGFVSNENNKSTRIRKLWKQKINTTVCIHSMNSSSDGKMVVKTNVKERGDILCC